MGKCHKEEMPLPLKNYAIFFKVYRSIRAHEPNKPPPKRERMNEITNENLIPISFISARESSVWKGP